MIPAKHRFNNKLVDYFEIANLFPGIVCIVLKNFPASFLFFFFFWQLQMSVISSSTGYR
jgi:hypothetical protein